MSVTRPSTPADKSRSSRAEEAYRILKEWIETNRYQAGHTALEAELAAELGMSRTPIREALVRLEQEGLVRVRPRRGMQVIGLSADDMRDIYEVIAGAEAVAVHLLARRDLTEAERAQLEGPVSAMEAALERDDLDAWASGDEAFHQALFTLCGNARVASVGLANLKRTRRARYVTLHVRRRPFRSTADHRRLVDLILKGKAKE
ncbi:MAG: GntR family transcriptional regulator, partial [Pseudomonadota bacterium]